MLANCRQFAEHCYYFEVLVRSPEFGPGKVAKFAMTFVNLLLELV